MTDYKPISCELYSHYELSIMHEDLLQLHWKQHGLDHIESLLPTNLRTRCKGEYLIARTANGLSRVLRLDRIQHVIGPGFHWPNGA